MLARQASGATVVINEILAVNNGGLADEDFSTPDWIELRNTSNFPVNLGGWHLTDSTSNLAKWTFPSTNLPAGAYLVVFASGKNRTNMGGPLHTNFQLSNGGEYLALTDPAGTVVSEISYPSQHANISFGVERRATTATLIAANATAEILVPTDGTLASNWTLPAFDSSAWLKKQFPIGFDKSTAEGGETEILNIDFNDDDMGETGAANTETGFSGMTLSQNPSTFNGVTVTLSALGGATLDDRDRATPAQNATLTQDQIYDDFIFASGTFDGAGLRIRIAGLQPSQDYTVKIWSFDSGSTGARVSDWIENASGTTNTLITGYTFDGAVLPVTDGDDTFTAAVHSSADGVLQIEGRRRGGTSHGVFLNGLRLTQAGYGGVIRSDVSAAMYQKNASMFIRSSFTFSGTKPFDSLKLRVRYDDGFIAYLNGVEVARRNAPIALSWNAAAITNRSKTDALTIEEIDLSNSIPSIQDGANILAIQALNSGPGDEDFLFSAELEGGNVAEQTGLFFPTPTPGAVNGIGYPGFVSDTKFSTNRGFFDSPITVEITTPTPGAIIRFTTNGSAPTESTGFLYSSSRVISNTTILRAVAFKDGLIPTDVDTQTYLFLDQVLRQPDLPAGYPTIWQAGYPADYGMDSNVVHSPIYGPALKQNLRAIPTLSIVTDFAGLWDSANGIYPNATSSGSLWERAASAELINPDGTTGFSVRCGIRMQGNASRDNVRTPKHSVRLLFKGDYGPTKLNYHWFPDTKVDQFDNIVLRACFTDSWATRSSPGDGGARYRPDDSLYIRDVWVKDSLHDMGWLSGRGDFVHLYLDGMYWGVYNPSERLDASYFAHHVGGAEENWDVIRDFSEALAGSKAEWDRMMQIVNAGITNETAFQAVAQLVDIDNLIDYMLLHIYAEAEDWPQHNWYAARRRPSADLPATKWIFLAWDQEIVLDQLVRRNRIDVSDNDTPAHIYSQLRAFPEFRRMFGDHIQKHLFNGGALTPQRNISRMQARAARIEGALAGESARWGDAREFTIDVNPGTGKTFTVNEYWKPELAKLYTNFFPRLLNDNVARFRAGNLFPAFDAPVFAQFGGKVPTNYALAIANPNPDGAIYYTTDGSDPRVYGTASISATAKLYANGIPIADRTVIRARVFRSGSWSALVEAEFFPPQDLSKLLLTEIMYNPKGAAQIDGDEFEFLELQNTSTQTLDLAGLAFTEGIAFAFTNQTLLDPGAFYVLARNGEQFSNRYPGVTADAIYSGKLDNAGEQITLSGPTGETIFSVAYMDRTPWPDADGNGLSLQLIDSTTNYDATNWAAATPSPGKSFTTVDSDGDGMPDWWEIANGLNPLLVDGDLDSDHDGFSNRQEYLAGTHPLDPASRFAFQSVVVTNGAVELEFSASAHRSYTIFYCDLADGSRWTKLKDVAASDAEHAVVVRDEAALANARFYRLVAQ